MGFTVYICVQSVGLRYKFKYFRECLVSVTTQPPSGGVGATGRCHRGASRLVNRDPLCGHWGRGGGRGGGVDCRVDVWEGRRWEREVGIRTEAKCKDAYVAATLGHVFLTTRKIALHTKRSAQIALRTNHTTFIALQTKHSAQIALQTKHSARIKLQTKYSAHITLQTKCIAQIALQTKRNAQITL